MTKKLITKTKITLKPDKKLTTIRNKIEKIDEQINKLLLQRMNTVIVCAKHKKSINFPIFDKNRETCLRTKYTNSFPKQFQKYYVEILNEILTTSKEIQTKFSK